MARSCTWWRRLLSAHVRSGVSASHPAGVAADWLTSAWGQNAGNHEASPAAAAAEVVAAKWLLDLLKLPREASVGFVTVATVANFVCLAAREARCSGVLAGMSRPTGCSVHPRSTC
jgi:glutamate/tyrosine decarboxylase-like PLP-dependent enzyme